MDERQKLINSIGLVAKSKKFCYGEKLNDNILKKKILLVLIVKDISENSFKKITNKCRNNDVEYKEIDFTSDELEKIIRIKNVKSIGLIDPNQVILVNNNLK